MALTKKQTEHFRQKLEEEKANAEEELRSFAKKDPQMEGDWDSKFPEFDPDAGEEESADEVEEYITRLPIEHALETRLKLINEALGKIENKTYGKCEKGDWIDPKRLEAIPYAKSCLRHSSS